MGITAIALAGVLGVTACGGQIATNNPASSGNDFVAGDGASTYYQAGHRTAAPAVGGTTLSGSKLNLSSYRGDVVVLNFWGSWCAPCRKEAPTLAVLAEQYQGKNVKFVGVDIRDQASAAQAFVQNFDISYPSLNDPADEIALDFRGRRVTGGHPEHAGARPGPPHRGKGHRRDQLRHPEHHAPQTHHRDLTR